MRLTGVVAAGLELGGAAFQVVLDFVIEVPIGRLPPEQHAKPM
jgi:hypothetical protein